MTESSTIKTYPTAFKEAAIKGLQASESVSGLARELGLSRRDPEHRNGALPAMTIFRDEALDVVPETL